MTDTIEYFTPPTKARIGLSFILGALIGFAVSILATSCAGAPARDHVLMPSVQQAWPGVKADVDRGFVASGQAAEQLAPLMQAEADLNTAIVAGVRSAVSLPEWTAIRPYADLGISDRLSKHEIGPNGAKSLTERVRLFDESIRTLNSR